MWCVLMPLPTLCTSSYMSVTPQVVQIIGISFNLIIIRVDSGRSFQGTTADTMSKFQARAPTGTSFPLSTLQTDDLRHSATSENKPRHLELDMGGDIESSLKFATRAEAETGSLYVGTGAK